MRVAVTTIGERSAVPTGDAATGDAATGNVAACDVAACDAPASAAAASCAPTIITNISNLFMKKPGYVTKENPRQCLKSGARLPLWQRLKHVNHHLARRSARGLGLALLALAVGPAPAKEARTSFPVSATVVAIAKIDRQTIPARLEISALDLERGFVDLPDPLALDIHSNSPGGFVLDVMTLAPLVSSLEIHGLDSDARLGADGGLIVQRWQRAQTVHLSLRLRLGLAPGVVAGSYPWPMRIGVRPLEALTGPEHL
jgi:hypothetical protein